MIQNLFIQDESELLGAGVVKKQTSGKSKKSRIPDVLDCNTCGLSSKCKHPRMKVSGKGNKKILFVGLCPNSTGDKYNQPISGAYQQFVRKNCGLVGIDFDKDCFHTNLVRCFPGKNSKGFDKKPTELQMRCCSSILRQEILDIKPKLVICMGSEAMAAVLKTNAIPSPNATKLHGKVFPYHELNCWVGCLYNPSFFFGKKHNNDNVNDELIFAYDLARIVAMHDLDFPKTMSSADNEMITNADRAVEVLHTLSKSEQPVSYDYETTTFSPFDEGARIICVSLADSVDHGYWIPIDLILKANILTGNPTDKKFWEQGDRDRVVDALKVFISSKTPKVLQNFSMEEVWNRVILGVHDGNFIHDTMVTCHVLNNRTGCNGLEFQTFELLGQEYKKAVNIEKLEDSPLEDICNYSAFDSRATIALYRYQVAQLCGDDKLSKFNDLYTRGNAALVNLKHRGIRIDVDALDEIERAFLKKMDECVDVMRQDEKVMAFEVENGMPLNMNAPGQWGKILYGGYKIPPIRTKNDNESTSNEALTAIRKSTDDPKIMELLDTLFRYRQYADVIKKVASAPSEVSKQIGEYRRVMKPDGRIHPTFNLHTTPTYRSSAVGPNSQNSYKHNKECRVFRRCITPNVGHVLLEADYSGIEFREIAEASQDKWMIQQIIEGLDPHRKWGAKLHGKSENDITPDERYEGKNKFVFPTIYKSMPPAISKNTGKPIDLIESLQAEFWNDYPAVKAWQERTIQFYNQNGYVEGLTGYRSYGPLTNYQISNFGIQGCSFGILLCALTKLDEFLVENGFASMIVNEIHDSIVLSADPKEVDDIIEVGTAIMTSKLFDWQTVPLEVEWEIGPNFFEMTKV